jgi:hypothetical protein
VAVGGGSGVVPVHIGGDQAGISDPFQQAFGGPFLLAEAVNDGLGEMAPPERPGGDECGYGEEFGGRASER